jgi:hypothetical protein
LNAGDDLTVWNFEIVDQSRRNGAATGFDPAVSVDHCDIAPAFGEMFGGSGARWPTADNYDIIFHGLFPRNSGG